MSSRPEDDPISPDSTRAGSLANVFRSLTSSKGSSKSPPSLPAPAAALPQTEFVNAIPTSSRELSTNHMDAYELLKNGTQSERISAANTLKYAITEYPVNPVLDIWYAAKDLIDPTNQPPMRTAGWELLTECAKHTSSTDLERKEYFQTLSAPANPEDFHLQLAALVDLSNHGRVTTGFEYDLIPLLTDWVQEAYKAARRARKNAQSTKGQRSSSRGRAAASGEEKNLAQLFQFLLDVIKFSSNNANEASITGLIESLLAICMNTSVEDDLRSCIGVLDAIVTFGSIPQDKLKDCIQVLSSIFCLVPALQKNSWHTIANLCKSHNGQAAVRIMLDILRSLSADEARDKDTSREVRGTVAVLQKLLSKTTEKGYPTVPYAPLVDGLSNALRATSSPRVYGAILQLINSLFDDGHGRMHRLIVDEDWSLCLEVAVECYNRVSNDQDSRRNSQPKEEPPEVTIHRELLTLISRLDVIIKEKPGDFVPREAIIKFFTDVHTLLPDATVRTVLDYFQEFRCCSPSDLRWEENLNLVLDAFFSNRNRSSETRLRALQTTMNAYEIVDLVGDGAEQNLIPRLAKSILQNVAEEADVPVLEGIMSLMVSVVTSCDLELFDYIIDTLMGIVINDRLKSPVASPATSASMSPPVPSASGSPVEQSPSNVVTKGYVKMFLRVMNSHGEKSARLFNALVSIAKPSHCEIDARLTAMKLLFRLRADWANRIFVTDDPETSFLATAMCRTDVSFAKKQAEEAAQSLRLSRSEHGGHSRASRGVSFSQGPTHERGVPVRTPSATKSIHQRYRQLWSYPDPDAVPDANPGLISPVLVSHVCQPEEAAEGDGGSSPRSGASGSSDLPLSGWLGALLTILQGSDWEVYSFVLVHLPSQLSNHAIFRDATPQIQELRKMICGQIRTNSFQEPPNASGLRRADVAICLFHSLTMILSYHEHFSKSDEDDIVKTFVLGIATWERTAKYCIHALSICCHELPLSTSKSLIQMLNQMAAIITQPHVSVHILEFLASLSRLHDVFVNFREDDFRIVFGICFRYLEYARDKRLPVRSSSHASEVSIPVTPSSNPAELSNAASPTDDLPQYVHALAYHVILFWFLALKLQDRSHHVGWIVKKLFSDGDSAGQMADEQTLTSIDFMQRVAYADVDESVEDPYFTEDRFGAIVKKQWVVGNSIITIKQAAVSGWAQIIKRQPSGTSAYTVRETLTPPPAHQAKAHVDVSREGQATTNAILPSHLLIQLMSPVPQTFESARPIPLPDDEATERAIRVFDRNSILDGHKVGVVYIGEGQTEEADILANVSGSSDYFEFLNNLGTITKLKGATFNTQGLDREYDTDGQYTFCWRDRVTEIVFHVTTQMPTNIERDPQCTLKKRHIGNDFVNIIFNDSGLPFKFDTFPSQFNFVNIVITPASRASFIATREADTERGKSQKQPFYRVQVMSKPGFPEVSPASETKMISLRALPGFIRLLALNASMFSVVWHNREGGEHISSWSGRLREIKRLREKHGPKATNLVPSPPPASFGAHPQAQQADSSRPSSSVRDSFNSLRRTSVATFFTSASEPPSHRSSTLSSQATSNDTEHPPPTGVSSLVESVDFSKWA